jgi:endonuclease YncB( thermonuclease family)
MSTWPTRPSLGRTGTTPVGVKPLVLAVVLACSIAVHLRQRAVPAPDLRPAAGTHASVIGKAWVIDGDTIDISGTRIRLLGIDAPESAQSCTDGNKRSWLCGRAATRELKDLIAGRPLACEPSGLDRYRRVLAVCMLPDGTDVNAWMVRQGWALAYGYSTPYRSEEAEAQAAKRGIWTGTFMAPWDWRHRHLG